MTAAHRQIQFELILGCVQLIETIVFFLNLTFTLKVYIALSC